MSFYPAGKDDEALLVKHLQFFLTCSQLSLNDSLIKRMDRENDLQKQFAELIDKRIQNMGWVFLIEFLRDHREEIRAVLRENLHGDPVNERPSRVRGEQRDGDSDGAPPLRVPLADGIRDRVRGKRPR